MDSPETIVDERELERSELFFSGALERISKFMLGLAGMLSAVAWIRFGWHIALGFVCGCVVSSLNFHWLKRVVNALADKMETAEKPKSSKGVVARFLLRYLLMGLAAYAIFTVSRSSLYGLFAGLFLPVAGIACEAIYELYAALKRGL